MHSLRKQLCIVYDHKQLVENNSGTFQQSSEGTITFKLIPAESRLNTRESKVRVRAHFDYDSSADPYIPCKEAGLDFKKGDVLHIVCQDDQYWLVFVCLWFL